MQPIRKRLSFSPFKMMSGAKSFSRRRILFLVTEDWYFCSHRLELARGLARDGWQIQVGCRVQRHRRAMEKEGFQVYPIKFARESLSPLRAWSEVAEIRKVILRAKPDLIVAVALRPVLFTFLALGFSKVPLINLIAGMGSLFSGRSMGWKDRLASLAVKIILSKVVRREMTRTLVQNRFDGKTLAALTGFSAERFKVLPGTGIDESYWKPSPETATRPFTLIYVGRLLGDKGLAEAVQAFQDLRTRGKKLVFLVVGARDLANPACLQREILTEWGKIPGIRFLGKKPPGEIRRLLRQSHCIVMPSYREGFPRVLLEAGLCRRGVVASDIPANRMVILHHHNGLLVPPRDPVRLASAVAWLADHPVERRRMAQNLRTTILQKFSSTVLLRRFNKIMGEVLSHTV